MRRKEAGLAGPQILATGRHLGGLARQARLARGWTQRALAAEACISLATLIRLEHGGIEVSLGGWPAVLAHRGLLDRVAALDDPASAAPPGQARGRRARRAPAAGTDVCR
ncbi:helix-turn-helix domain-containing protein [Dokdonella koreensis]|uniref:HTH cro/C1-type domain-containing protein n=1 Tax=Dokdonella koreensis DS-123 TaxID=1300342 RepID=A0A160DV83_9GAMM|nr:helix-turn-helix transcriptional regulator [Dokdonella koreensis]ANB18050.1 Hypothetical protein I596_2030 [Dokdonella koreensis DS-123]